MAKEMLYTVVDSKNPGKPYLTKVPLNTVAINLQITEEEAAVAVHTGKLLYDQYRIVPVQTSSGSGLVVALIVLIALIGVAVAVLFLRKPGDDKKENLAPTDVPISTETPDPFLEDDFIYPTEGLEEPTPTPEVTEDITPEPSGEEPKEPTPTPEPEYESVSEDEMLEILNDKVYYASFETVDSFVAKEGGQCEFSFVNNTRNMTVRCSMECRTNGNDVYIMEELNIKPGESTDTIDILSYDYFAEGKNPCLLKLDWYDVDTGDFVGSTSVDIIAYHTIK